MSTFTNTGRTMLRVKNYGWLRKSGITAGGLTVTVRAGQTKWIGPFPVERHGEQVEYTSGPRLAVEVVDLDSLSDSQDHP
jgi:hypothetical protein